MLPRKDWLLENVVRVASWVTMSWFLGVAVASVWAASWRQKGIEVSPLLLLAVVGLAFHGVGLTSVTLMLRWEKRTWKEAFGLDQAPGRSIGLAAGSLLLVAPAVYGLHAVAAYGLRQIGWEPAPQSSVELLIQSDWAARAVIAFFAVLLAPVAEEVLFRGLFFAALRDAGWPRMAWLGTALLFGLIHGNAAAFLPLTLFAFFLTWLYQRTGNLLAPVVAHTLFNIIPFVLILLDVEPMTR